MTSMLDRVLGKPKKLLSPNTALWWVPKEGGPAQNISCAISTGYSLADDAPEQYEIPFIAGEVTVGEGVDVFPLANGGTLIRRFGKPAEPSVKLGFDPAEKYEGKLTFFRDSSDTTPFDTVFNLFKEPQVTTPAKPALPDYAKMERPELLDRLRLLDNALAATEDNVRTYMDRAKKAEAKVGPQENLTIARLEAAVREQDEQIAVLEQDLVNQKSKYKGKLKECGAVIGTLKGMIKELTK